MQSVDSKYSKSEIDHRAGVEMKANQVSFIPVGWAWAWLGVVSILVRIALSGFESDDYRLFLARWYDFYVTNGRWEGLAQREPYATYPPLYLYLISLSTLLPLPSLYAIKLWSILSDYFAAFYLCRLVRRHSTYGSPFAILAVFLFLPTVVLNSALWGQCDMMYTAAFLASFYYLLERRPVFALIAFGISASLKPQAIFWCPFLAGLFISGRFPWRWTWVPLATYTACGLPAILAGRPWTRLILPTDPGAIVTRLTWNAPNWYQWVWARSPEGVEILKWTGIMMTVAVTFFFAFWMLRNSRSMDQVGWLISAALFSILYVPFLLPGMHERYFFPADIFSLLYAVVVKRGWIVAVLVQLASLLSYFPFLFRIEPIPLPILSFGISLALLIVIRKTFLKDGGLNESSPSSAPVTINPDLTQ